VIQGFIKCIGIFVCIGTLAYLMPADFRRRFNSRRKITSSTSKSTLDFMSKSSAWVMIFYGFSGTCRNTRRQTLVQRYLVAKTDRDALKGVASARCSASRRDAVMLIGTLTWAYYKLSHEMLPAFVTSRTKFSRISSPRKCRRSRRLFMPVVRSRWRSLV